MNDSHENFALRESYIPRDSEMTEFATARATALPEQEISNRTLRDKCMAHARQIYHFFMSVSQIRFASSFQRYCLPAEYRKRGPIRNVLDACDVKQHPDAPLLENHA